uniref:hypothetical protein n=1 Tax=Algoriphagus sp. TaxID=1872435 RepID=UPI00258BD50C|nr:hypothetical protein [Algoriphagus sp.]
MKVTINSRVHHHLIMALYFIVFTSSCYSSKKESHADLIHTPTLAESPSRNPHFGFEWEKVSGAGIEFWAQKNEEYQVAISETLPGAMVEMLVDGEHVAIGLAIQVFRLKNQKIEDVLEFLQEDEVWDETEQCVFMQVESNREGVERYVLQPSGSAMEAYQLRASQEPINFVCGIWGMANSGIRYFEIHKSNPSVALFLEIGQEAPLFDEQTIIVK